MTPSRSSLRRYLGPVVRAALVLIGISAFLPRLLAPVPVLHWLGEAFDAWFAFQCHREPGRSLAWLPVCTRCFGIYAGLGLGALVLRPRLGVWPLRIWVGVAAVLMVLDVVTEGLGLRPAWPPLRIATGVLLSYPVGSALVWAATQPGLRSKPGSPN